VNNWFLSENYEKMVRYFGENGFGIFIGYSIKLELELEF